MKLVLQTLLEELTRLKNAGQTSLPVSESSLQALRNAVTATSLAASPEPGAQPRPPAEEAARPSVQPRQAQAPAASAPQAPTGMEAYLAGKEPASKPAAASPAQTRKLPPPPELQLPDADKASRIAWLASRIQNDPVWKVHDRPGRHLALDSSNIEVSILFVGDSPTEEEESKAEVFSSDPGQLFIKIIQAMGLKREQVHLGYALPWRPVGPIDPLTGKPAARDPSAEEINYGTAYLKALVDTIQPPLIVALGATASKAMLGTNAFKALSEVRGQWREFHGIPLLATFHPNYLKLKETESKLAEKKAKRTVWEDMLKVMERSGLPISEKQRAFFS